MGVMATVWKVLIGLALVLPMTAYVVHGLVAVAQEPVQHDPIIVEQPTQTPDQPRQSPSEKPTKKSGDDKPRGHDQNDDHGGDDPQVITPSPDDLFDDNGGDDNSGKGSDDDDSSGKGSGHD